MIKVNKHIVIIITYNYHFQPLLKPKVKTLSAVCKLYFPTPGQFFVLYVFYSKKACFFYFPNVFFMPDLKTLS
jgi:hypothetical protein